LRLTVHAPKGFTRGPRDEISSDARSRTSESATTSRRGMAAASGGVR
jgi:hypothetical protein